MEITEIIVNLATGFVGFVTALLALVGVVYGVAKTRREALDRRSDVNSIKLVSFSRNLNKQYGPSSGCSPVEQMFRGASLSLLYLLVSILALAFYYALLLSSGVSEGPGFYALIVSFCVAVLAIYAFASASIWNLFYLSTASFKALRHRWGKLPSKIPCVRKSFEVAGSDTDRILTRCAAALEATGATIVLLNLECRLIRANMGPSFPTVDYSRLVDEITISAKQAEDNTLVEVSSTGTRPGSDDLARNHSNVDRLFNYLLKYSL